MNYESLIFDIDGTLWDSRALVAEGYNLQLKDEGLEHLFVNAQQLKALFGKVMTEIADVENPCAIGYPGVKETLIRLAESHRLFIVSNSQRGYPELCIRKLGLGSCITACLCFGDTGTSKGKTIRTLMQRHNIRSCAYIGDTQGDYEATLEAGIPFIWASYGFGVPEGYGAKIDRISDLLTL